MCYEKKCQEICPKKMVNSWHQYAVNFNICINARGRTSSLYYGDRGTWKKGQVSIKTEWLTLKNIKPVNESSIQEVIF